MPLLSLRRELLLRGLVLAWAGALLWFWLWLLAPDRGAWNGPRVVVTMLLAWIALTSAYFAFYACRMTRPDPAARVPELRVAMVVTKAPAEPWCVIERTLTAMLAQQYPHDYDVWVADERPTPESLDWCRQHGVKVSSRLLVRRYHRSSWPRRTKCKEGNLAYFYDRFGYARYDVVAQLDADHVAAPGYLAAMVRPFQDPSVGYVAAPSICDANISAGWTVRGRLFRDASMHGPVQAGCNDGWAPMCHGSHYAVRTAALRDVGGLGPELAEDYSTTLWLQSAGWQGVFSIDAEAHGDGPESLPELLTQEMQWARSLGTILTRWAPGRWRTVPWRARLRLMFCLLYYPVQSLTLLAATLLPLFGMWRRSTWGNTSLAGFYVHLWPVSLLMFSIVVVLRRWSVLRPTNAKLLSWELALFQLIRWPWVTVSFLHGAWLGARGRERTFKVTPKGDRDTKALRPAWLLPTLALGATPAWFVVFDHEAGVTAGLMVVAVTQAISYLGAAVAAVVLHLRANRHRSRPSDRRWADGASAAALTAAVVVPSVAALTWRLATFRLG